MWFTSSFTAILTAGNAVLTAIEADVDAMNAKMPAAAAGADAASNATVMSASHSRIAGFNSVSWDRIRLGIVDFASDKLASMAGTLRTLPMARYLATRPTLATTEATHLQANTRGDLSVQDPYAPDYEDNTLDVAWGAQRALSSSTGAWTNYSSGTTKVGTAGIFVKNAAGRLRAMGGANASGTVDYYLVGVNKASAPVANDDTVFAIPLSRTTSWGTSAQVLDFGTDGLYLSAGIAYAISTTPEKVTLAAALDCKVWAQYY